MNKKYILFKNVKLSFKVKLRVFVFLILVLERFIIVWSMVDVILLLYVFMVIKL